MKSLSYRDKIELRYTNFVREYIKLNFNGLRAYKNVYNIDNDNVARASAPRLLARVSVQRLLAKELARKQRRFVMDRDAYVKETEARMFNEKQKDSTKYQYHQLYGQLNGWLIDKKSIETKDTTEDSYRKALKAHTDRGRELVPDDAIDVEEDKSIENID